MEIITKVTEPTTLNIKLLDPFNIQLGDNFNNLINQYVCIAKSLTQHDPGNKINYEYIEGIQKNYYGMFEALYNKDLIKEKTKIIDIGCGVCSTLYNLSKQFKYYKADIECYGVEYNKELIKLFQKYLYNLWDDTKLSLFTQDLFEHNYSEYDLILCFTPFKKEEDLEKTYTKVFNEMKPGALFFENWDAGKGKNDVLLNMYKKPNIKTINLLFGGRINYLFTKTSL